MARKASRPGIHTAQSCMRRRLFLFVALAVLLAAGPACRLGAVQTPVPPSGEPPTQPVSTTRAPSPVVSEPSAGASIDPGDPLPPRVITHEPRGGQELSRAGTILLYFDQPMHAERTAAAWRMVDPQGHTVPGEVSWPDARTLAFTPSERLAPQTHYLASLTRRAENLQGLGIQEDLTFEFTTAGDLQVSQVFPLAGAQDVDSGAAITVIFNRPVVPLVSAEMRAGLPDPLLVSPPVTGRGEWINTSVYAFQPESGLRSGTDYTVVVAAGLEDALAETQLDKDFVWQFSTATPSFGYLELGSGVQSPENDYRDLLLDDFFRLYFNQPMDPQFTEAALEIVGPADENVPYEATWNTEFTRLVVTPTRRLALNSGYTLRVSDTARAGDGGVLPSAFQWNFRTVPAPTVVAVSPADGARQNTFDSELRLKFASPMNIESVKARVEVSPPLSEEAEWWYNEYEWSLVNYGLQPSTAYEVRLLPGMQDIYGNAIRTEQVFQFTTAAYDPEARLQMPYAPAIFRAGETSEFYVTYRNIEDADLSLYRLSTNQFLELLSGRVDRYKYAPPPADQVWAQSLTSAARLNERVLERLTLTGPDGGPPAPGFYFLALDAPQVFHEGPFVDNRLVIVATGNLTFKSASNDTFLWFTDLDSGAPVPGVSLTVYDGDFQPAGSGVTNAEGVLQLDVPAPDDPFSRRYVLTDGSQPQFAFASSEWGSGVNLYDFGLWTSYYAPPDKPAIYLYTERPIYRPGQPVYFKGVVRFDDDLDYQIPQAGEIEVTIDSFEEQVFQETLPLTAYGTFSGEFNLAEEAALGYYSLSARFPGADEPAGVLEFNVAEYRRPEFQVEVSAGPENVLAGESFTVDLQADYFSGGGVAEAQVDWTLSSDPYSFSPGADYSGYSFDDLERDLYYYDTYEYDFSEQIASGQAQTDGQGHLRLDLPADLSETQRSRSLTFEGTVVDLSGNPVSGRAGAVVHRSRVYPGVRPETYVGQAGDPQAFEVVVLDWEANAVPQQEIRVEIVERRWNSVQVQDERGRIEWQSEVEEIPIASFENLVVDGNGRITVSFTPPNGGIYRAVVSTLDAEGNPGRASAYMWVAGEEFIPWRQTNERSFDLVADRDQYAPGDTAELLIASPFQGPAYALVTVERGRVRFSDVILLESNSTVYRLPVTADMAPNVYASVLIVKGVDENNPRPNFKLGMVELKVDTRAQELTVELIPDRTQVGPGEDVTYAVLTRDKSGAPVSAEVSLALSDLATLSLVPPNTRPLLDFFYAYRTLSVWTAMPMFLDIEDYNAELEEDLAEGRGGGSGGKGGGVLGVIEVREDFPDTAYWNAHVVTDENGEATVTVTLPDNLTTWRMDARAVTPDTRVGQTTLDIVSSRPLLVRPQTPRFFVAGDWATIGTGVQNNTDETLSVAASLVADGLILEGEAAQTVEIPAGRQVYLTWDVTVEPLTAEGGRRERVDLVFSAEGRNAAGEVYSDASRPTLNALPGGGLPVYHFEARETVATSGQLLEGGTVIEAISLPPGVPVDAGSLRLQVAPSLAAGMSDSLAYLEHYPYECIEQTVSRFLPNVVSTRALRAAGLSDSLLEENLAAQVSAGLQRLYNAQNPDGGWGWWGGEKSDPLTTAYAALGLIEADEAGYAVSAEVLPRALDYLRGQMRAPRSNDAPYRLNRQAFLLYVLARAGEPDVSNTVQLFDLRQNLALYGRAFLAEALLQIDPDDPRLDTLRSDFISAAILSATGAHWEEAERDPWNWNTDTRTTAILLSTLSRLEPENPLVANAVRWLMYHRTSGRWASTQETAWALMALTNWMEASGELAADYEFAVALNTETVIEGQAGRDTLRQPVELRLDVKQLFQDELNRLAFARSDGEGNLYYTAYLDLSLPVSELGPLDQGIIVSRSYYRQEDLETPVAGIERGELLVARLTVIAPHDLHFLVVEDPLPAGLEAVDTSLETSPQAQAPRNYEWEDLWLRGWGWWTFDHIQMRDEKLVLSADYLPAGTYVYNYLVRAGTAGEFQTIPPTAQEFYFPEVYGRGEGMLFIVTP